MSAFFPVSGAPARPRWPAATLMGMVLTVALGVGAAPPVAFAQLIQEPMKSAQKEKLRTAVEALTREANHLEDYEQELEEERQPSLPWGGNDPRPHQTAHGMGAPMAPHVLKRMLDSFTGNLRRDLYIRWHLLHVVKQARPAQRERMGPQLVQLLQKIPGPLEVELKQVRKHVPEDLWSKYHSLRNKTHVVTGYPPFQRHHSGRSALEHVGGAKKEKLKKIVEKMEKLREQIEVKVDEKARAFNRRVRKLRFMARRYRGEVLYEALRTGDPEVLKTVTKEVVNRVTGKDILAFDLLSFMYLAALDGVLNQYPDDTL
jgi:hypothetical protein